MSDDKDEDKFPEGCPDCGGDTIIDEWQGHELVATFCQACGWSE